MNELFKTTYGSHLYGTSTPTSDFDYKVVYLPPLRDILLGRKLQTLKARFDAQGQPVTDDNAPMPDGGFETEYIPLQTFCRDYLGGQTYALEVVMASVFGPDAPSWMWQLYERFTTCNVSSMAGFAMKQTFDYVHRGARLEKAKALLTELEFTSRLFEDAGHENARLDTVIDGQKVLYVIANRIDIELGTTINNGRTMVTLKLNGREYLETTTLNHLYTAVEKLVASYGHRSQAAAEAEVDRKSLMHAVRVYQQALELLETGRITFPRANAAELLWVKTEAPMEEVKAQLLELEGRLTAAQAASTMQVKTPELEAAFEEWLLDMLEWKYGLR